MLALLVLALLVQPVAASKPTKSAVYTIEKTHQLPNYSTNAANDVVATIFLLDNRSDHLSQQILSEQIKVDGALVSPEISSTGDNRIAQISLSTIDPDESKTITVTQTVRVDQVEPIDVSSVQGDIPPGLLTYTEPIAYLWESDNEVIKEKALELTAGQTNFYCKAKQIFNFVKDYLIYQEMVEEHGAVWAYNNRRGDCTEFTNLFIALCRAAGIPAKFVSGYGYKPGDEDLERMEHAFALIYLPNVGWVPVDLTWAQPQGQFGELSYDHVVQLTSDGNNMVRGAEIRLPGNKVRYKYGVPGPDPNLNFESVGRITKEVAVEPKITAVPTIEDSILEFSVTVKNTGLKTVTNLRVELSADETYFEVPPAESVDTLSANMQQVVSFDVQVKADVENAMIQASVTYDSQYGTFLEEGQMLVSVSVSAPSEDMINIMLLVFVAAIIGLTISVAVALARR